MSNFLPAGAGRFVDHVWPDPLQLISSASAVTQSRNRLLNVQIAAATGGFGGGGATTNVNQSVAAGCCLVQLAGGGADGIGQLVRINTGTGPGIYQLQAKGGIPSGDYLDMGAGRVYGNYAYTAFGGGAAAADSGLEVTTSGGLIQSQSTAGVGFGRSATNVILARAQQFGGGAGTSVAVTGAGTGFPAFDSSLLHSYELQFTSATPTVEATISWLIDGIRVRSLSFGVGTLLPTLTSTINAIWTVLIANVAQGVNLNVQSLRIIQAPTIAQCF